MHMPCPTSSVAGMAVINAPNNGGGASASMTRGGTIAQASMHPAFATAGIASSRSLMSIAQ